MAVARARLAQYARWQMLDYAFGVGGITLVVVCVWIWGAASVKVYGPNGPVASSFDWLVELVGFLGSAFATTSLISEDRTRGYYRLQFAKPVNPLLFYGQAFVLRGIVIVAIAALISALGAVTAHPAALIPSLRYAAVMYVLAGGVTLLQSTVWRYAWVGTCALFGLSVWATQLAAPGVPISTFWHIIWSGVHAILPPLALQNDVWVGHAWPILWCVGYGALALAGAALVIRGAEWAR
jgi:ABC-type transport system involved in multi-copper enzyme maturation permease subunit